MSEFIITEKQLSKITETITFQQNFELANKNWENFTTDEKEQVVECLKIIYPERAKLIKEATGWNTLGDIVGIFDPTGVVDLVNGISYIIQGDNLFGFLSLVSAVPYVGDFVAKPMMAALKVGAPSAKNLSKVMALSKAGKGQEAAKLLAKLTEQGGLTGKFVAGFGSIAKKLRGFIERIPVGMFKGFKNTILQWFDLFETAAKSGKNIRTLGGNLSKRLPKLSKEKQLEQLKGLKNLAAETGLFKTYRTDKGFLSWKTLFAGLPQLMGRNASVRSLMRQTKWWAGFLDYIGYGNFVGPEEISKKMGEEEFMTKMNEYQNTPQSQQNFTDDFGTDSGETQQKQTSSEKTSDKSSNMSQDPVAKFFNNLFSSSLNPVPGV